MSTRANVILMAVGVAQIGLFGALGWYASTDSAQGPSLRSLLEIAAPFFVTAISGGSGWVLQRRYGGAARVSVRWFSLGAEFATLAVLALIAVLTPIVLFVEVFFEGIG